MNVVDQEIIKALIEKVNESNKNRSVPQEIIDYLHELWEVIQENYLRATTEVFDNIKNQRNFIIVRFAEIQRRFLEIIQRKDDKLVIIIVNFSKCLSSMSSNTKTNTINSLSRIPT